MTKKEELRERWKLIALAVFAAEKNVKEKHPDIVVRLRDHTIGTEEYLGIIADEILAKTPEEQINELEE